MTLVHPDKNYVKLCIDPLWKSLKLLNDIKFRYSQFIVKCTKPVQIYMRCQWFSLKSYDDLSLLPHEVVKRYSG